MSCQVVVLHVFSTTVNIVINIYIITLYQPSPALCQISVSESHTLHV